MIWTPQEMDSDQYARNALPSTCDKQMALDLQDKTFCTVQHPFKRKRKYKRQTCYSYRVKHFRQSYQKRVPVGTLKSEKKLTLTLQIFFG